MNISKFAAFSNDGVAPFDLYPSLMDGANI